jgi:uncharacterized low-complexity protein
MSKQTRKPVVAAVGVALAGGLALSGSAFAMDSLAQGYALGAAMEDHGGEKHAEGKCGEGRCGMDKMDTDGDGRLSQAEYAAKHDGNTDGFAGIDTDGDGFVSAAEMDAHHAAGREDKGSMEGKCGEGKCGGAA